MTRRKASKEQMQVLEPITPQQQSFVEALLAGKSITDAAMIAKISRRAATYWMNSSIHPVRREYDKQRLAALSHVTSRVASLHELAFKAMEELLSPSTPPAVRFQMAKLIYESQLQEFCKPNLPQATADVVAREVANYYAENRQINSNRVQLFDEAGNERLFTLDFEDTEET